MISRAEHRHAPRKATILANDLDPATLGTLSTIMEEDFAGMTAGSAEAPAATPKIIYNESDPAYTYPWTNMKPGYCNLDGWGSHEAQQAGGMVALVAKDGQAHINTCMLNIGDTGLSVIEFKAKSTDGNATLLVEAANTFNMSPTWDIFPGVGELGIPAGDWNDVKVVFRGSGEYVLYNIVLATPGTVLIDDVKVSAINPFVAIPSEITHSDYTGDSFNINWKAVEGADKYLVTIYEANEYIQPQDIVVENAETDTNSYFFEAAIPGEPYFVEVKAVGGERTSYPSDIVMIWDVAVPEFGNTEKLTDWTYKTGWEAVEGAEVYNYMAYSKRVPEADGTFVITKEKYNALVDHDGNRTGWSHENNEGLQYDEYNVQGGVNQAGWRGKHSAPFDDYLCIDGWWYIVAREDAGLLSPELDLSADGGKATLKLKLASEFMPKESDWNEYGVDLQTQCAVAVFAWDEAKGDYSQVRLFYIKEVSLRWTEFTVALDGLTDRCVIGIYAIDAPLNLYVAELSLTQERKAGESFLDPYHLTKYQEGTEITVDVPPYNSGCEIFHKAQSVTSKIVSNGWSQEMVIQAGAWSPLQFATETPWNSGVKGISAHLDRDIALNGNRLTVTAPEGEKTEIFATDGRKIASGNGNFETHLPARGIYIVAGGEGSVKVVY